MQESGFNDVEKLKKEVWALKEKDEEIERAIKQIQNQYLEYEGFSPALSVGETASAGSFTVYINNGRKLVKYFGLVNCTKSVTFKEPFTTLIWANSANASVEDSKSFRSTIKTITKTGITFYAGANVMTRYEVLGIIN